MIWNCYHFKKWNTKFTRNQHIFKNSHLLKNILKKHVIYIDNYAFIIKIYFYEKFTFVQKKCNPFLK